MKDMRAQRFEAWLIQHGWLLAVTAPYHKQWLRATKRGKVTSMIIVPYRKLKAFESDFAQAVRDAAQQARIPEWQLMAELHGWTAPLQVKR